MNRSRFGAATGPSRSPDLLGGVHKCRGGCWRLVVHVDVGRVRLRHCYAEIELCNKSGRKGEQEQQPDIRRQKDEPGNGLVDTRGVLRTFVERPEPPDLDNRNLAPPHETLSCGLNSPVLVLAFLPVGGDEEDIPVDYNLAIMKITPNRWLGKPILDPDVAGILKGLGNWNNGLEHYRATARPLRGEDVPSCGACRL